ncbi:YHS domain-containing protein [Geobacter grbiciae]|uniref:YHS domain-containing protein n=1 Tax=Geobacter grbiciae TaxID=155042 RepID=UPI001C0119F1|nr:YHS domain-containing protein [Geobacter grbiciae]MBT1075307.1 YHS domain-containing protein [Geobacter grbiciae]
MRLIIMLILFYVGFRIVQGFLNKKQEEKPTIPDPEKEETFQDPVCGVYVTEDDAVIGRHEGKRIHFCSMACLEKYQAGLEHAGTTHNQSNPEERK